MQIHVEARIPEWGAILSFKGSSHIAGRFFTVWPTREVPYVPIQSFKFIYRNGSILHSPFFTFFLTINFLPRFFNGYRILHCMDVPFVSALGWLLGTFWKSKRLPFPSYNPEPQTPRFSCPQGRATQHFTSSLLTGSTLFLLQSLQPPKQVLLYSKHTSLLSERLTSLTSFIVKKAT